MGSICWFVSTWIIHCLNNDRTKYFLMYCGPLDLTGGLDIFFQFSFLLKCTYGHNSFTISQSINSIIMDVAIHVKSFLYISQKSVLKNIKNKNKNDIYL